MDYMSENQPTNEKTPPSIPLPGKCSYVKPDATRCNAYAVIGSDYCFVHDPGSAEKCRAARINGGIERSRRVNVLPPDTPDVRVVSAADITMLIAETISQLRRGQIDPGVANSVGYLTGMALRALQRNDLDQRVARLESILTRQEASSEADTDFEFVNPSQGDDREH